MEIKLNEDQYKKLLNEVGGYDDPSIGAKDEESILKLVLEAYLKLRGGMDSLQEILRAIVVQDELKTELHSIRQDLVKPLNNFTELMLDIKNDTENTNTL